jgi:hypothetical protein
MKLTLSQEWIYLFAFFLSGVLVFFILYVFAIHFIAPAEDVRDYYAGVIDFVEEGNFQEPAAAVAMAPAAASFPGRLTLKINERKPVGGVVLIYRGFEPGHRFRLDVMIPAMDAKAFYPRVFGISEARDGFKLADRRFELVSARETFLHLKLDD